MTTFYGRTLLVFGKLKVYGYKTPKLKLATAQKIISI